MITWKAQNSNRLLTEVKQRCSGSYTGSDIRWSIEHNRCFINGHLESFGSAMVQPGDTISIAVEKKPSFQKEEERVFFENGHFLVYDKPPYISSEDLAELLKARLVHRLDRDTSGILLLAKNKDTQTALESQFRERVIEKKYMAWVEGQIGPKGTISGQMAPLSRREGAVTWAMSKKGVWSETNWERLGVDAGKSLVCCMPITGRTHQIRVHFQHLGHPLVGDVTYGKRSEQSSVFRPLLHASGLKFFHPGTGKKISFESSPPSDFPCF